MLRKSLLLFAFSIASRNCLDIPHSGNVGFRLDSERRDAQFGETIRDWFKNIKNKLGFGNKDTSKQTELPNPLDLNSNLNLKLYQTSEAPSDRLAIHPGNLFLDLSNLKFDPNRDWGFRLSNWYVIRKAPTNEQPYTGKVIQEWPNWKDDSSDAVENVIELGLKHMEKQNATEPSSFTTTTTFRNMIPESTVPQTTSSFPETTTMKNEELASGEKKESSENAVPQTTSSLPETTTMKNEELASGEKKESSENAVVVMPVQDLSVEILSPHA